MQMDKDEPTVPLKLKDTVKVILMLEDAIEVLIVSARMFVVQKDAYSESDIPKSVEGEEAVKNIENGIETLKSKIVCRQFFLKDFKERINETGIDIDAEIEKYKESFTGE